jgi:hypothetical protein
MHLLGMEIIGAETLFEPPHNSKATLPGGSIIFGMDSIIDWGIKFDPYTKTVFIQARK